MDRRQKRTRDAIFAAFARLLAQQNYSRITVQDIIDEANVGRSTFYAHFETRDALLRELCTELFDHVFSDHPGMEASHNFSLSQGDTRTIVTHILYHLQDNGKTLARLLTGESSDVFLHYFRQYMNDLVRRLLLADIDPGSCPAPEDFLRNHITGSFVNMVQWWIAGGMKETPEELSGWFLAVIWPIFSEQAPQ